MTTQQTLNQTLEELLTSRPATGAILIVFNQDQDTPPEVVSSGTYRFDSALKAFVAAAERAT